MPSPPSEAGTTSSTVRSGGPVALRARYSAARAVAGAITALLTVNPPLTPGA
ncbi:hypothetical protein OG800_47330 [Streptomyces sp. NBC_00445]|uniref:hypothetical protein n=1 Tax=Streptomyces sp. NBC_00445 TaxID=2975745 RepID=UPI002E1EE219